MIIYTHYNLDLDAASTTALAFMLNQENGPPKIAYVGADITFDELSHRPDFEKDFLILDIDCEGKGLKGKTTLVGDRTYVKSAFNLYLSKIPNTEIKEAYQELAKYIDKIDSGVKIENRTLDIQEVFRALKKSYNEMPDPDATLIGTWIKVIEGLYINWGSYKLACYEAEKAYWPFENIAVIKGNMQSQVPSILRGKGAEFVLYEEGNNMGILIDIQKVPYIVAEELGRALPGWFVHQSGFLVSWGTRKALKQNPPNINIKELIKLVNEVYNV